MTVPTDMLTAISSMRNTKTLETRKHLELAAKWLLAAQRPDGGYSHSYNLLKGWSASYPETTGYIIPSMLGISAITNDSFSSSAVRAGEWLLKIQNEDGSFSDLNGKKQVFDSGQIIYGFLALYDYSRDKKWLDAAVRSGEWLVSAQEKNGSWIKNAYNEIPHTYYSRVGSILIQLGIQTGRKDFISSGKKNLDWTISRQAEDGYFADMAFFPGIPPYLHTIIYVLEGLLHGYSLTKEKSYLSSALKTAERLRKISSERDFILHSQYAESWVSANKEKCITGLAQWAGVCLNLFDLTKDVQCAKCETFRIRQDADASCRWRDEAIKTIYYLKAKQLLKGSKNILGAIPSSIPIWGKYGKFSFFNWNSKFFMDALAALDRLSLPLWMEQQIYVQEAFKFSEKKYYDPNAKADYSPYMAYFDKVLSRLGGKPVFVDIGCGGGALLNELQAKYLKIKWA